MVFLMFQIVKKLGVKSGKQFAAQQAILGQVNGFVEEHIEGQKVVKVFNHETLVLKEFETLKKIEALADVSTMDFDNKERSIGVVWTF